MLEQGSKWVSDEYDPKSLSCCSWGKISLWNSRICTFSSLSISAANFECLDRDHRQWFIEPGMAQTVCESPN